MKKIGIVLLSLGLIAAFSMSASAVTPEWTGQYYARGSYASNPSMLDQDGGTARGSVGYFDQRLRNFVRLKIADGLTMTGRFDTMETIWGQNTKNTINGDAGKTAQQSIAWEQTWVTFKTGIGTFDVGYKSGTPYGWGTKFMNAPGTAPGIKWSNTFGNLSVLADFNKVSQGDLDTGNSTQRLQRDASNEYYDLGASYKFKDGNAGLLYTYFRNALTRSGTVATSGAVVSNHVLQPYARAKVGPVNVEAEAYYMNGRSASDNSNATGLVDTYIQTKGLYLNAKANLGPAYVGGRFVYASGDDKTTRDAEGGQNNTFKFGTDTDLWGVVTPAILFGYGYHGLSVNSIVTKGDPTSVDPGTTLDNVLLFGLFGGVNVGKNLELSARAFYAKADMDGSLGTPTTTWQGKEYGKEVDLLATYKIYDQLTYNLGFAYLWTGDWFKGLNSSATLKNIYYVSQWIDLNF